MATETVAAPVKEKQLKAKPQPRAYIFRLLEKFPQQFEGSSPHAARFTIPMMDDVLWPYKKVGENIVPLKIDEPLPTEGDVEYHPRRIRYVVGSNSIFVEEQEKTNPDAYKLDGNNRNRLLDNEGNRDHLTFEKGEINVPGHNRVLRDYLWCTNQCKNQHRYASNNGTRMKALNFKYEYLDFSAADEQKVLLGKKQDEAYEIARTARAEQMLPHAKYLNISFTHMGTDESKDVEAIRQEYKDKAIKDPVTFLRTFSDPTVKVVYQIRDLIEKQKITIGGKVPGQAHWIDTGAFICDLPPDKQPVEYLAEFSLTKAGEEFAGNMRALK